MATVVAETVLVLGVGAVVVLESNACVIWMRGAGEADV